MGMETISYRASQLWNLIPGKIKQSHSLSILKEKIRIWHCDNYPCRLGTTYIANIGFGCLFN